MPDAYRVVDRIQDQSDFDSGWSPGDSDGYALVWDTGTELWTPSINLISILIGTGATLGTDGVGVIAIHNDITPTSQPADEVQLFAADYAAGDSRLQVWSESGTALWIGNGSIAAASPASGAGNPLTLSGSAAVSGNTNGGDTIVQLMAKSGSGVDGKFKVVSSAAADVLSVSNTGPKLVLTTDALSAESGINIKDSATNTNFILTNGGNSNITITADVYGLKIANAGTCPIGVNGPVQLYINSAYKLDLYNSILTTYTVPLAITPNVRITSTSNSYPCLALRLPSGTPTADGFQMTLSDGTTVLTNVTADGYVYSRKSDATQYAGLRGSGSSPAYPGLHCYHDSGHGYFTLGYGTWEAYIGTTPYWSLTSSLMANNTVETRLGLDSNVTVHEIRRRNSIANAVKGGGLKIHADNGPTGATNSDGGDIWVYGGTLRGTGIDGDVHLGYDGTNRKGKAKIYVPAYPAVSPTVLSADVNDYAPTPGRFQRWATDGGNYTVTGLDLDQVGGQEVTIINLGSGTITLSDQNGASSAANQFLCVSGSSITLDPNERSDLLYDATSGIWKAF